jgi:hypothetical protein
MRLPVVYIHLIDLIDLIVYIFKMAVNGKKENLPCCKTSLWSCDFHSISNQSSKAPSILATAGLCRQWAVWFALACCQGPMPNYGQSANDRLIWLRCVKLGFSLVKA